MATVKYYIKGEKPPMIYIRLRDGRDVDLKCPTGLTIQEKFWSKEKSWVKPKSTFEGKLYLENTLKTIESLVYQRRNERISKKLNLNLEWLKEVLSEATSHHSSSGNELLFLLEKYKQQLSKSHKNGRPISSGTIRNYNTTMQRLKKYEDHTSKTLILMDIDLNFHTSYLEFAQKKLKLSINSIGKDFRQIKTVCLDARDKGMEINPQSISRKFNVPTEKTIFTTLSEDDLKLIKAFEGPDYLNNAKEWLIIGCWIGARVNDLMSLTKSNIKKHGEINIIQYTQSKTGKTVKVPLHPDVMEIIKKNNGFPRPISDVKFNKYIKEVGKCAGLTQKVKGSRQNPITHKKEVAKFEKWELLVSHVCRRSFATNHYNKLPNKVIMAVTGHSTEKMLLQYIGETEHEHINDYLNLWTN